MKFLIAVSDARKGMGRGRKLPDDLRVCNCAGCGELLRAKGQEHEGSHLPPLVFGRVNGKPWCWKCATKRMIDECHIPREFPQFG